VGGLVSRSIFFLWKRGRRREREPIGSGADVQLVWVDEGKIVEGHTRRQGAGREGLARRGAISLALTMTSGSSGLFSCKEEIHLLNCQYWVNSSLGQNPFLSWRITWFCLLFFFYMKIVVQWYSWSLSMAEGSGAGSLAPIVRLLN
jgi:hypothetical protein